MHRRLCWSRSLEMVFRLDRSIYAPFYALFLVGPAAMLIEMWMDSRREARADRGSTAVALKVANEARMSEPGSACLY